MAAPHPSVHGTTRAFPRPSSSGTAQALITPIPCGGISQAPHSREWRLPSGSRDLLALLLASEGCVLPRHRPVPQDGDLPLVSPPTAGPCPASRPYALPLPPGPAPPRHGPTPPRAPPTEPSCHASPHACSFSRGAATVPWWQEGLPLLRVRRLLSIFRCCCRNKDGLNLSRACFEAEVGVPPRL